MQEVPNVFRPGGFVPGHICVKSRLPVLNAQVGGLNGWEGTRLLGRFDSKEGGKGVAVWLVEGAAADGRQADIEVGRALFWLCIEQKYVKMKAKAVAEDDGCRGRCSLPQMAKTVWDRKGCRNGGVCRRWRRLLRRAKAVAEGEVCRR